MAFQRPKDWRSLLFVHAVVLAGCLYAGGFVAKNGAAAVPVCDEWYLLADWQASESTPAWWLAHHYDHRYPVGKAVWLTALRANGYDFRRPMFLTVGLLTAASVLLLWTVRGARGSSRPADALLPALLLHLGHAFNLLMGYQVTFALFAYAVVGWVWCAGRFKATSRWRWLLGGAAYAGVAVLSGGFGLVFTAPLVAWLTVEALADWKRHRPTAAAFALLAALALGYSGWVWFTRLPPTPGVEVPARGPADLAHGTLCYLATGFGDWHLGHPWQTDAVLAATAALYATAAALLLRSARRSAFDRALLAVLALLVGLGLATTWVRGGGIGTRFVTPSAVGLAACFLAISKAIPRRAVWFDAVCVLLAAGVVYVNNRPGVSHGYQLRTAAAEFRADVDRGLPAEVLEAKYEGSLLVVIGGLADDLRALKGMPALGLESVPVLPPTRRVPVPGVAVPFDFACRADQLADPPLIRLPDPPAGALGVALTVTTTQAPGWQRVAAVWNDRDTGVAGRFETFTPWLPKRDLALLIPFTGAPTGLRIVPLTHLEAIQISRVEWLMPTGAP